jgi:hypothetical protein
VFREFDQHRGYVSHTLCKNRLGLVLIAADGGRRHLADASIWPLVADEVEIFCDWTTTLYGLQSGTLYRESLVPAKAFVGALREGVAAILAGEAAAFERVSAATGGLSRALSGIRAVLERVPADYSEPAVRGFLAGRDFGRCTADLREAVRRGPCLRVVDLVRSGVEGDAESYRRYWAASAEAWRSCRVALVAGVLEGVAQESMDHVRDVIRALVRTERLASCWSPVIPDAHRAESIDYIVSSEGFTSADEFSGQLSQAVDLLP